ncbi:MAG: sugar ABC transporter substrate-binding protein, partial [Clostridia bacterium]
TLLEGGTVESFISVPTFLITSENVDEYGTDGWQ